MTHVPRAQDSCPIHPSEDSRQRKDLPPRPEGFRGSCIYYDGVPHGLTEPDFAHDPTLVGGVEWHWSIGNSRRDNYFIERRGKWWLLWTAYENPLSWESEVTWELYGAAESEIASEYEAAIYTLMDAWAGDEVDHVHEINHGRLLSVEDIREIARVVWPKTERG